MKVTTATKEIKGNDASRTFVLSQPPIEQMLKVKKFEGGVAEAVFLNGKEKSLKKQLKIVVGCFEAKSNVAASLQYFFETRQPLREIQLELDGVELTISKKDKDITKLCKKFRQMQQKEKEKKEQSNEQLTTKIRNRKLTMVQKQERRKRRERWIKGIRR